VIADEARSCWVWCECKVLHPFELTNFLPLGFPLRIPDKPLQVHRRLQLGFQRMIEQQRPGQVGELQRAVAHPLRHMIDVISANKRIASLSKSLYRSPVQYRL
jgi:hypothetical protein